MIRYLKIFIAGISFAVIIDVLGIIVGIVKCISSGLEVDGSAILSVALGSVPKRAFLVVSSSWP